MLILTRKHGQKIKIGDDITISIAGIHRGQVRVAIDAPKSKAVHRQEIYERIQSEKKTALRAELI